MTMVLVTGGAGFIGSHLVERLLDTGAAVRILDNLSTGSLHNLQGAAHRVRTHADSSRGIPNGGRLEVVIGDIRDGALVRKATRSVDAVFHLAAVPSTALGDRMSPSELETVNVQGTLNVLQAAVTEGVGRLIFASSASVYGTPESVPVFEDCPPKPESLFAASKLAAEMYCRTYSTIHKLEVVTLRYFTVYGPRQVSATDGALIPELIEALRQHPTALARDRATEEDLTYVDDAVEATWAAAAAPQAAGHSINIGSGRMASVLEILHLLHHLLKLSPVEGVSPTPARSSQLQAATTLAARLLGCTPRVSLAMGLTRVVRALTDPELFDDMELIGVRTQ